MKLNTIIALLFIALFIPHCFSQDYVYPTKDIDKVEITARTSVILKTHKAPNLLISSVENKRLNKNNSGLKSTFGKDNTGFNVFVEEKNGTLMVESFQPRTAKDLIIYLPETIKVSVENLLNNDISISDFKNEVEAKTDTGDIRIINVYGPVIVDNSRGDTYIIFKEVNQNSPMSIINSSGDVDITMPSNTKADIEVSVPRGELYTDFTLVIDKTLEKENIKARPSRYIKSKLNNGGVSISIIASRGNVYLRKQ